LPKIISWLKDDIWTPDRLHQLGPVDYLIKGEKQVCKIEEQIFSFASRVYNELATPSQSRLIKLLKSEEKVAVVVLDGLSLREVPSLLELAKNSGYSVIKNGTGRAALPSETMDFVAQQLGLNGVSPSKLPKRKELKAQSITAFYLHNDTNWISQPADDTNILVWSSFPDNTYTDSGARFANHFKNIASRLGNVWMSTVQQIPHDYRIIITSDHGYVFFDSGTSFDVPPAEKRLLNQYFGNDRNKIVDGELQPPESKYIHKVNSKDLVMITGRVKTTSTGKAASLKYKHGGLSLMEMVTPWIEIRKD